MDDGWFPALGKMVAVGISSVYRTNVWSISCPYCGQSFKPQTTMMAFQNLTCPNKKCKRNFSVNYNELTMRKDEPEGL